MQNKNSESNHWPFKCCELMNECNRKDMVDYACKLIDEDRELEALGVLKLVILWIESKHQNKKIG